MDSSNKEVSHPVWVRGFSSDECLPGGGYFYLQEKLKPPKGNETYTVWVEIASHDDDDDEYVMLLEDPVASFQTLAQAQAFVRSLPSRDPDSSPHALAPQSEDGRSL